MNISSFKTQLRKLIPVVIALNLFVFINHAQTAGNAYKPKNQLASGAYGFLMAQQEGLSLIEKKFPNLQNDVIRARLGFDIAFGKAEEEITRYLQEYMGPENFKMFRDSTLSLSKTINNPEQITPEIAKEFLKLVESRINGIIPSPYLETLLAFNYKDSPANEYIFGFTNEFSTLGHPKAKNTDWKINVPISWKKEEGSRPNVIQKFSSDMGFGGELVLLMVKDLEMPLTGFTKSDIEAMYTEENFRQTLPEDAQFVSFSKITIDNIPGGVIEMDQVYKSPDFPRKLRLKQYSFIYKNKTYVIQCSVSSKNLDEDLSSKMSEFSFLFKMMVNSVVVNEQYK
jgi:hypothetical protein